ncbi:NAD+ synthase [Ruicaihuangia caeni]|uniref:NAD+ synthase n=1 Tax=Ruicaihuangia caeni TaxID=3042517 RepID=UPI00338EC6C8
MPRLRVALAQLNPVLGDLEGNSDRILDAAQRAAEQGAQVLAVGECALSGYPIEDLAGRASFLRACGQQVEELAVRLTERGLGELIVIVGHPDGPHEASGLAGDRTPSAIAQNAASVLQHGRVQARYAKHHLPNYAVFDEYRTFIPGRDHVVLDIGGCRVAVLICEDLWRDAGPVAELKNVKPGLILTINASPFERDKQQVRLPLVQQRAREANAPLAYVNIVGGQDDLVFDGDSLVVDASGTVVARAPQFEEHVLVTDIDVVEAAADAPPATVTLEPRTVAGDVLEPTINEPGPVEQQVWNALVLGTRDYVNKNRFPSVVLGLSGGIDSAVCAVIAADAIGADRVHAISLPSRYSSEHSRTDADELAERVGIRYSIEPIADLVSPIEQQLELSGVAAENLQARVRAIVLMAASNMHGHLLLTTGNKSEISVGYSTIYGDSAGGFAPIRDVPKSLVWKLATWRNEYAAAHGRTPPIPENSITKPPSAELRPDQTDQDSLPPYEVLDPILDAYVTRNLGVDEIVALGYDAGIVSDVVRLVDHSEWKRRQGAIGPKISAVAFGRDRRLPITYRPSQ